jgi:ubiquinone/menaquinone biosynthesis C-methylase UbiE
MSGHWDDVYAQRAPEELSWFQPHASLSLELIDAMQLPQHTPLLDVGAGTSLLVDGLLERGFSDVTLLDISMQGLEVTSP